jgi:predicted TIM-barrel fold metal-dependent hydrolase
MTGIDSHELACLPATSHQALLEIVSNWIASLTVGEREAILGGTAVKAYRISRKVETER